MEMQNSPHSLDVSLGMAVHYMNLYEENPMLRNSQVYLILTEENLNSALNSGLKSNEHYIRLRQRLLELQEEHDHKNPFSHG